MKRFNKKGGMPIQILMWLTVLILTDTAWCASQSFKVTVISSESVMQSTGETSYVNGTCKGESCTATTSSTQATIPVRFLYVIMDGRHIRLQAKQRFMSSYGKTLPPGEYQGNWKNPNILTIHYTDSGKTKSADYVMAGV